MILLFILGRQRQAHQALAALRVGVCSAGHVTWALSTIIFCSPRVCHLSERLRSSTGRTVAGEKAPVSGSLVASRSTRCHRADVIGPLPLPLAAS